MKLPLLFLMATVASASAWAVVPQEKADVPEGWTKINICHISFYAPPDLKKSDVNGIDSCMAQYANNDIALYLDYGRYGGPATARGSDLEWKQESRSIGGKDAQLITFVQAQHRNAGLKYVAALYVVVKPVNPDREWEWPTTLEMSVTSDRRKDRDAALAIFRTISFE
jgi:hypothetical protein